MNRNLLTISVALMLALAAAACTQGRDASDPVASLKAHSEAFGRIAEQHVNKPVDGVKAIREYVNNNLPDMMGAAGDLIAQLDRMDDAAARAELMARLKSEMDATDAAYKDKFKAFSDAVTASEEAMAELKGWGEDYLDAFSSSAVVNMLKGSLMGMFQGLTEDSKWSEGKVLLGSIRSELQVHKAINSGQLPELHSGMGIADFPEDMRENIETNWSDLSYFNLEDVRLEAVDSENGTFRLEIMSSHPDGPSGIYTIDQDGMETGP